MNSLMNSLVMKVQIEVNKQNAQNRKLDQKHARKHWDLEGTH